MARERACVDERAINMSVPAGLENNVVMERCRALSRPAGCCGKRGWGDMDFSAWRFTAPAQKENGSG